LNRSAFKLLGFLFFLLSYTLSDAQELVFLDEDLTKITENAFQEKCSSNSIYDCVILKNTNELIIAQIKKKMTFGEISEKKMNQIYTLLAKDTDTKIESTTTLVISYHDSLADYESSKKQHEYLEKKFISYYSKKENYSDYEQLYKKKKVEYFTDFNKTIFNKRINRFIKQSARCKEKYEKKFPVKVVFIHDDLKKYEKTYDTFKWVKDRGIIKSVFFEKIETTKNNRPRFLVLKPNGEFFVYNGLFYNRNKILTQLLKTNHWDELRKELTESSHKNNSNGKGVFKRNRVYANYNHCF